MFWWKSTISGSLQVVLAKVMNY